MEDKEKLILDFLSEKQYVPMKAQEIAFMLNVPKNEYSRFMQVLSWLEKDYKIQKNRKSRYSLVDKNKYISGVYSGNEKGFGFVKLQDSDEEIYISKANKNGALNGDTVVVEIIDVSSREDHKEGKIVSVTDRKKDIVVGVFTKNKDFGFVVPDDRRFGSDVYIPKKNVSNAKNNDKVVVKILKYPENGKNAEGKITEILGKVDEAGVDMMSLIRDYNLPYEFPVNVIKEAKGIKDEISLEELNDREDFRNEEIFTIDGEDAKDLDDAVEVKKLKNGNYELSVFIADVSHYVREKSALDREAYIRGTSIYMLDRVIPMLPKELSNGICSLNQGKDRLVLSCIMEINKKGEVVSSDIKKGVINVTKRMSYTDVKTILNLENKKEDEFTEIELKVRKDNEKYYEHFKRMEELALILKNRRTKDGSLNLDIPETKIVLDENGFAIDVKKYDLSFANEIIEQFMLTANETIAERFYWIEAPFIYRVHEVPDEEKIEELNKFLYNFGYKIKGQKDEIKPKAFAMVLDDIKGKEEERVISTLILRTLKVARYEAQNKGHFGIASKYYCHFTSPIRRYPDLFIHRIISYYLDKKYNVSDNYKDEYNQKAVQSAEQSSEREKVAQKVERDSIDIKKAEYMQDKIGNEYEGIVSSITAFGMFVELENTVEGLIRFEDMGNEYFVYDEERKTLTGDVTLRCFHIGDKVKVRVKKANKILRQVDFELIQE